MELSLVVRPSAITWNLRVDPGDGYVIATVLSSVANGVVQSETPVLVVDSEIAAVVGGPLL